MKAQDLSYFFPSFFNYDADNKEKQAGDQPYSKENRSEFTHDERRNNKAHPNPLKTGFADIDEQLFDPACRTPRHTVDIF